MITVTVLVGLKGHYTSWFRRTTVLGLDHKSRSSVFELVIKE